MNMQLSPTIPFMNVNFVKLNGGYPNLTILGEDFS